MRGVARVSRLAVAAHVPEDHPIAVRERRDLPLPHARGRAIAVRQQEGWSGAMAFVMNADPALVDRRHDEAPVAAYGGQAMIHCGPGCREAKRCARPETTRM